MRDFLLMSYWHNLKNGNTFANYLSEKFFR